MIFCPHKIGLALAMMAALATLPVLGQQATDLHPKTTADAPNQSDIPLFTHELPTPDSLKPDAFHFHTKPLPLFDALPGSPAPPPMSPEAARQWQKSADEKKNWTLMTPEEILNIPTEEKIMGIPEPDDQKNLTVEQRYLNRLNNQTRAISATNALRQQDASLLDSASQGLPDGLSQDGRPFGKSNRPISDIWGKPLNPSFQRNQSFQQNPNWHNTFIHTRTTLAPDPEQVAAMERFRILLGSATPEKLPSMYQSSPSTIPTPDPNMQVLPAFNPAGNSFTPMKENFNKPAGLMPLPGIVNRPVFNAKPALYAPKLPPWLTGENPTPGTQQRVF
jgi:hypothetical protein